MPLKLNNFKKKFTKVLNLISGDRDKSLTVAIFLFAMLLRFLLAAINEEAFDGHIPVIDIIMREKRIPITEDCWECFQPKLYHLSVAIILKILPHIVNRFYSWPFQVHMAQFLNCIAGGITLYFAYLFLAKLPFMSKSRTISFSIIALNPKLIGINAMATNDSFVILFSTICLYYIFDFFSRVSINSLLYMAASAILAALSKGNGLVLFPIIMAMFLIKILFVGKKGQVSKTFYLLSLVTFSFLYFLCVPYLGQYYQKYEKYGSPFTINMNKDPIPHFIKRTYVQRPGVISIVDSYLTFRFFDLIVTPYVETSHTGTTEITWYDKNIYPLHRTSLWTQLYGSTHFSRFEMWPPSWKTSSKIVQNIGRCIFLLALIPSLFMVVGATKIMLSVFRDFYRAIRYRNTLIYNVKWIFIIAPMAYLLFLIAYTLQYRDFATMKAIFIFPGLLCFLYLLIHGMNFIYRKFESHKKLILCLDISLVSLVILYCGDVLSLIIQLSSRAFRI